MFTNLILDVVNYFKSSLNPEHFWDAASAIANSFMVLMTFLLLKSTVKSERDRNRREFVGEIVAPVLVNLNGVEEFLRSSPTSSIGRQTAKDVWQWASIKSNVGSTIYRSDKTIIQEIDDYDLQLRKFDNLLTQQLGTLVAIIGEEFRKKMLPQVVIAPTPQGVQDVPFFDDIAYNAQCRMKLGGKDFIVMPLQLILFAMTFQEYLDTLKQDPTIANTEITYQAFMIGGLPSADFNEEVYNDISLKLKERSLSDQNLKEFVSEYKDILRRTEKLRKILLKV